MLSRNMFHLSYIGLIESADSTSVLTSKFIALVSLPVKDLLGKLVMLMVKGLAGKAIVCIRGNIAKQIHTVDLVGGS